MISNKSLRTACYALTVAMIASTAAAEDRIDLRSGQSISGRVQQETATEVMIDRSGSSQRVAVNEISQIHYEGQPAIMTHARAMEAASQLNQAAAEYAKAQEEIRDRPLVLRAARFGEARTRALLAIDDSGQLDQAIARLESFEQENPDSRQHYAAQELLARLYIEKADYAKAEQAIDTVAKSPWRELTLRAVAQRARMLRLAGKFDQAIRYLNDELETSPEQPEQVLPFCLALVEQAKLLRAMDRRDEEATALEQAIDRSPLGATALQAEAYVALGHARRAKRELWEAAWAFLHVQVLFAMHEDLHAEALYNLSQLWSELGRPDRAAATRSMLKNEHPKSAWTKKLEE
jgi:tetratricopeptide (TPR) repeat protein